MQGILLLDFWGILLLGCPRGILRLDFPMLLDFPIRIRGIFVLDIPIRGILCLEFLIRCPGLGVLCTRLGNWVLVFVQLFLLLLSSVVSPVSLPGISPLSRPGFSPFSLPGISSLASGVRPRCSWVAIVSLPRGKSLQGRL